MKKRIKYPAILLLALMALVALVVLFTQTPMFKSWLKNKLVAAAQPYLNGELAVGDLEGNLFNYFLLKDFTVTGDNETVVEIKGVYVRYRPLALLSKQIVIPDFIVDQPDVKLRKQANGSWNIMEIIKSDSRAKPSGEQTQDSDFGWGLHLPALQIKSGKVAVSGMKPSGVRVPDEIKDIELQLGFAYADDIMRLTLQELSFEAHNPSLKVKELESSVKVAQEDVDTTKIELKTEASTVESELEIENLSDPTIDASLEAKPLSMDEIRRVFTDLPLYGKLRCSLDVSGALHDLRVKLNVWLGGGEAELTGSFDVDAKPYRYEVESAFSNIDLGEITRKPKLRSDFNFAVELAGVGTQWGNIDADFSVNAAQSLVLGNSFDEITFDGQILDDSLSFRADLVSAGANSNFAGYLVTREQTTAYELTGDVRQLNLQAVMRDSVIKSDLNLSFHLNGQGLDPDSLAGRLVVDLSSSQVAEIPIDSAHVALTAANQRLEIEECRLVSPLVHISANGGLGAQHDSELSFDVEFEDLSRAASVVGLERLDGVGKLSGSATGTLDSVLVNGELTVKQLELPDIRIRELNSQLSGRFSGAQKTFAVQGELLGAAAFGTKNLSSNFDLTYQDSLVEFTINLEQEEKFSSEAEGEMRLLAEGYKLNLRTLSFDVFDEHWQKVGSDSEIQIMDSILDVGEIVVSSEGQSIRLSGKLDKKSGSELKLQIDNLELVSVTELLNPNAEFAGRFDLEATVTGALGSPKIEGDFSIVEGRYRDEDFYNLTASFGYLNDKLDWQCVLSQSHGDSLLRFNGFLPYHLSLSPFENELRDTEPVRINLSSAGLDLTLLQGFTTGLRNIDGKLVADIVLQNTLQDLHGTGPIRLLDARFDISDLGIKLRDIEIALALEEKELVVNEFRMESGGGDLAIVDGSLSLSEKNIDEFKVTLQASDFEVMNTNRLEASVSGDIEVLGSIQAIELAGDLTVTEADVYYPAWMQKETAVELTSQPFFVVATDSAEFDSAGAMRFQKTDFETETPFRETEFYKNISGKLSLTLDRNTWLRSEEANREVHGKLEFRKQGADVLLFGTVTTVRGYYEVQGRRFEIVEGEINFRGDPEYNPNIQLVAVHELVDRSGGAVEEREVKVTITGTKEEPQFEFTVDGQPAEQKDILALLLFGKSFAELSISQGNTASEQSSLSETAQGFFAGQLMKSLSQRLGDELKLDVLQIESGDELADTKVEVGKYLTGAVFVSVSQDFGAEGAQKVTLEYKLPQDLVLLNLFLQALKERQGETAVDVIWKHEW